MKKLSTSSTSDPESPIALTPPPAAIPATIFMPTPQGYSMHIQIRTFFYINGRMLFNAVLHLAFPLWCWSVHTCRWSAVTALLPPKQAHTPQSVTVSGFCFSLGLFPHFHIPHAHQEL